MHDAIDFLRQYGPTIVFLSVLLEQAGLPVPCTPWLIAAGALARLGHGSLELPIFLAALAASLGHIGWFLAGRQWGNRVQRAPSAGYRWARELRAADRECALSWHGPKALIVAPSSPADHHRPPLRACRG